MHARLSPRFAALASALAFSAVLGACLGGTGTDTENGLSARDASGAPLASVRIHVRSALATPDSLGGDPVVGGSENLVTDANGFVSFHVERPGAYLVEGRRGDTVLFIDTLRASSAAKPQAFVARPTVRLRGRIRLLSGFRTDTGLVFLRGTGLASTVKADGTYDLGWGPADAFGLTVGLQYDASPASRAVVKMAGREHAGKIVSSQDWTQWPAQQSVYSNDSLTLFKAALSKNTVCLESSSVNVTPAYTVAGSIKYMIDVVRETGVACGGHAGALIETQAVNANGQPLEKLGDFVLPDTLAWGEDELLGKGGMTIDFPASQRVVLAECVRKAADGVSYRTTVKGNGEVRVDDLIRGLNCLAEIPAQ